jgi:hypothetical protein
MGSKLVDILEDSLSAAEDAKRIREAMKRQLEATLKDYRTEICLLTETRSKFAYNQRKLQFYDNLIAKIRGYLGK